MQKNWQGRLKLLGEMTIEVPKEPSCEMPKASRGWGLGRDCTPSPVDQGAWRSVVSSPAGSGAEPRKLTDFLRFKLYIVLKV